MNSLLLEMELLDVAKETENKLRWDTKIDETPFSLYIPKWRVPLSVPRTIAVLLVPGELPDAPGVKVSQHMALTDASFREKPIAASVAAFREHTRTLRYNPLGDEKEWEIGCPYVPFSLTFNRAEVLTLIVFWDVNACRQFQLALKKGLTPDP